eukprot:g8107.t1
MKTAVSVGIRELSVPLAARLAEALGLPGLRPAAVDAARNKHATRGCLKTAGLPTPRNFLITEESKLQEAAQVVGFPAVLKPVSGAASLGVKKVTNPMEMGRCYKEIVDELSTLVVSSGALVQGSPDNKTSGQNAMESGVDLTVLMEQFLDGPEVDVDVVMSDGARGGRLGRRRSVHEWGSAIGEPRGTPLGTPFRALGAPTRAHLMSMDTEQLLKISLIYSYVLAATVFLGGVMGFVKAKSKASLIVPGHQSSLWFHMDVNDELRESSMFRKFMPFGLLTLMSCLGVLQLGCSEYRYACVSDNGPTLEPYFNETWACCPSLLPKDQQVSLRDLAVDCIKALGFTCGVFHVECKYTSHGPHLIEVNARMGGGQVHECNRLTWGVCLETLLCALGIPSRPFVPREPISGTAYCYVNAGKSGTVKDMSKLEELIKRENVVWAKPLTRVGAQAVGPADGLPTWLCDLFVRGKSAKEALEYLQAIEKETPVVEAIRTLLPTATFQMLAKVPKTLLTQANDSAKQLRRQLMRGAVVVFVTAGLPGKKFTFEIAVSLGVKPVILEHPDSWSLAAKFIPVDMTQDSEAIFQQALQHIRELGEDGVTGPADGIAQYPGMCSWLCSNTLFLSNGWRGHNVDDSLFPLESIFRIGRITRTVSSELDVDGTSGLFKGTSSRWPVIVLEVYAANMYAEVMEALQLRKQVSFEELNQKEWIASAPAEREAERLYSAGLLFSKIGREKGGENSAAQTGERKTWQEKAAALLLHAAQLAQSVGLMELAAQDALLAKVRLPATDTSRAADSRQALSLLKAHVGEGHPLTGSAKELVQELSDQLPELSAWAERERR